MCSITVMFDTQKRFNTSARCALVLASAAVIAAVSTPSLASASPLDRDGGTTGGSAVIIGGEGTQVIVDDTTGSGLLRTTEKVGGGVWIYGIGGGNSYSYYDHSSKTHKSTACAGFGTSCKTSGWVGKGTRSVAQILKSAWGNTAFWDTK